MVSEWNVKFSAVLGQNEYRSVLLCVRIDFDLHLEEENSKQNSNEIQNVGSPGFLSGVGTVIEPHRERSREMRSAVNEKSLSIPTMHECVGLEISVKIPMYQVDAFTQKVFAGNPAAVCPLETWLPESTMQAIAAENNLAETAFFASAANDFKIRWFTPEAEVALCGHATLASAVVARHLNLFQDRICFHSKSGPLFVDRKDDLYTLNFPLRTIGPEIQVSPAIAECLGTPPVRLFRSEPNYLAVFSSEEEVRRLNPDFRKMKEIAGHGIIATARGTEFDFVSRFFAPAIGVDEDPVTGSAHCTLIPYWSAVLNKTRMVAYQASRRGGVLNCELKDERALIGGYGALYSEGFIFISEAGTR